MTLHADNDDSNSQSVVAGGIAHWWNKRAPLMDPHGIVAHNHAMIEHPIKEGG